MEKRKEERITELEDENQNLYLRYDDLDRKFQDATNANTKAKASSAKNGQYTVHIPTHHGDDASEVSSLGVEYNAEQQNRPNWPVPPARRVTMGSSSKKTPSRRDINANDSSVAQGAKPTADPATKPAASDGTSSDAKSMANHDTSSSGAKSTSSNKKRDNTGSIKTSSTVSSRAAVFGGSSAANKVNQASGNDGSINDSSKTSDGTPQPKKNKLSKPPKAGPKAKRRRFATNVKKNGTASARTPLGTSLAANNTNQLASQATSESKKPASISKSTAKTASLGSSAQNIESGNGKFSSAQDEQILRQTNKVLTDIQKMATAMGESPPQYSSSTIRGAISRVTSCQYVSSDACITAIAEAAVGILGKPDREVTSILDANFGPGKSWERARRYVRG